MINPLSPEYRQLHRWMTISAALEPVRPSQEGSGKESLERFQSPPRTGGPSSNRDFQSIFNEILSTETEA